MPAPRNIEKMSVAELSELQRRITAAMVKQYEVVAADFKEREAALEQKKVDLREKLARMATDLNSHTKKVFGGAVVEVPAANGNGSTPRKRRTRHGKKAVIAIKYRNPHVPTETWTGRGRAPRWLTALEKKGGNRAAYAVTSQAGA